MELLLHTKCKKATTGSKFDLLVDAALLDVQKEEHKKNIDANYQHHKSRSFLDLFLKENTLTPNTQRFEFTNKTFDSLLLAATDDETFNVGDVEHYYKRLGGKELLETTRGHFQYTLLQLSKEFVLPRHDKDSEKKIIFKHHA